MNPVPFPDPPIAAVASKGSKRKTILINIGLAATGALFGFGVAVGSRWLFGADDGLAGYFALDVWTVAALPMMWMLTVVVHEFGHLLGGKLAGMRPLMLFAGPLHLDFGADRLRLRLNRVASTWGGLAACAPVGALRPRDLVLLIAGGPLASFMLAAGAGFGGLALGGWWGGFVFGTGALSLVIGIATLLPVRAGGYMSDGGQLLGLARGDRRSGQQLALAALMAQSYSGVRPRAWDSALLDAINSEGGDPGMRAYALLLGAIHAEDRHELTLADTRWREVAQVLADADAQAMSIAIRRALALPIATWIGYRRHEAQSARAWLEAARGGFADAAALAFAEAAVHFAEGNTAKSRSMLAKARAALPQMADRGSAIVLAESLHAMQSELDMPPVATLVQGW